MGRSRAVAERRQEPRHLEVLPGGRDPRLAAVIDLGSNSWRVVVYRYAPGGPWRQIGQLQEPVRIGEGLEATGALSARAVRRGRETLEMFARFCAVHGVDELDAVATSAIRDASNRDELLAGAPLPVRILSAQEEARLGYLAAVNSTTLTDGTVLDLGGGSLQLVAVEKRRATRLESWPLGAVRVTERLLPSAGPASHKELKRARAAIRKELGDVSWLPGPRLVGLGGAVRNLARAAGGGSEEVQGRELRAKQLEQLIRSLAKRPPAGRALPGIKPARADVILAAALVLEAVLEHFRVIEVTRAGLREGVFFERRLLRGRDPLLTDVRAASVRNLVTQDVAAVEHAADLAVQLHDSLGGAPAERELLWAAAMVRDIGLSVGHAGHGAHSQYLVDGAGLPGFSPDEVTRIGQIVRQHHKGQISDRLALLVRIAEQLDEGVTAARFVEGELHLEGDDRLARWRLARAGLSGRLAI